MRLLTKFIIWFVISIFILLLSFYLSKEDLIITAFISLFLIFIYTIFIFVTILKPLNRFLKTFADIAKGQFNQRIIIKTKDEFSILSRAFNQMMIYLREYRINLEERIKELSALERISRECSYLEEDKLLLAIVNELKEVMNVDEVILFLKESEELVIRAKSGIKEERLPKIKFKIGEGIAGWVAEKGAPCMLTNPEKDYRFKVLEGEFKIVSLICVPLKVKDKIIGVLSVGNYNRCFTKEDLRFFNILTNQVATSLYNSQLYKLAITDELTDVYIKRYFNSRLENELQRAKRYKLPLSVIMVDIDYFKNINDKYGHIIGDEVLTQLGKIIKDNIRVVDIPARVGGEEFVVILPQTNLIGAKTVAERLREEVENSQLIINGNLIKFTISCGVVELKLNMDTQMLMKAVDNALYKAKEEGRNRVCS